MKYPSCGRISLLLLSFFFFMRAACWAQTETSNWTSQKIGSPKTPGTALVSGTGASAVYTLTGQGYFSGNSDSGQFYYQTLAGDGTLIAEVTSVNGAASASANAGVMIRASNAWNSAMIYIDATQTNGLYNTIRATKGDTTTNTAAMGKVPYWVKVVRSGASFSGYVSSDGTNWTQLGTTITMDGMDAVDIGLAATSNGPDVVTATLENVTLTLATTPVAH